LREKGSLEEEEEEEEELMNFETGPSLMTS
jgi:hypothetical protein